MRIVVNIEEVEFDGLLIAPGAGRRVGAALRTELERSLAAVAIPKNSGVRDTSSASAATSTAAIARDESSDVIGRRIAAAVHGAIVQCISGQDVRSPRRTLR
jgi:hypothetical protein